MSDKPKYTCTGCGKEMRLNVPRLGPDAGFVHKDTGNVWCENAWENREKEEDGKEVKK